MVETRKRHQYVNNFEIENALLRFESVKEWNSKLITEENKNSLALTYLLSKLTNKELKSFDATVRSRVQIFLL